MKKINIHLIRHGESVLNKLDVIGQKPDTALSKTGREQSELLGARFKQDKMNFDRIFCSTYTRARDTATISLSKDETKKIEYTDSLIEYSPGDWNGMQRSKLYSDNKLTASMALLHMGFPFPNGETLHQVERRATSFLEDNIIYNKKILAKAEEEKVNIALFSHGQTIKCILHYIMGFDQSFAWKIKINNTSISRVSYDDRGWSLHTINDTAHLR